MSATLSSSLSNLARLLGDDSPASHATGRFWVDQDAAAWVLAAGGVDLFLQRRDQDRQASGPLHHVMRVLPGQAFFAGGCAKLPGEYGLLAVPLPGTVFHALPGDFLQRHADSEALARLCEDWVSALARGMNKPPAPRQSTSIDQGAALAVAPDQFIRAESRVAWLTLSEGNCLWMGRYDSVANPANGPLPLPRELWLKTAGNVAIASCPVADLLRDGQIWPALARHQQFVLRWIIGNIDQAAANETERLQSKAQQSLILTSEALQKLLSVTTDDPQASVAHAKRDSCLAACRLIAPPSGIVFREPHSADIALLARDPVAAIAAASRIRYRRVVLKGAWWTGDNGPLIASLAEGGEWVALLPARRGYQLCNPASGKCETVTEDLAALLSPFATMFYRPLPDRALRLLDIGVFALQGRGKDISLVLALGVLAGLLGLATPIATATLVNNQIPAADTPGVWQLVGALIAAALATTMFEITRSVAVLRMEGKIDSSLEAALWDRLLKLPVPFFRRYSAGDLALRVNGINAVRRALSRSTVSALISGIFSIFNFGLLFYYSPSLALIASLLIALAILVTLGIGLVKLRIERTLSEVGARLHSTVFQYLGGIVKLRLGSAEGRAFANWAEIYARYRGLQFKSRHWANVEHTFLAGYATLATAMLFAAIGLWMDDAAGTRLDAGQFIAFSAAFGIFFGGMVALAETLLGVLNLVPIFERTKPILDAVPETDDEKAHPGELLGGVELANVSFGYENGPTILHNISLSVRPGGFIALVGPSGSGKSTLLRLLLGFEKPTSGSICYDANDLAKVDLQALRRQLGVVLQNGQLIPGDIFSNIVGTSTLSIDDAWEAARLVGLDRDIQEMPMGMHTVVGEGASTLSGGQRQRILIARAIVHRPRMIFFDEATSALDNRTQSIVTQSLDQLKATRIVIAHRLSTVVNADRIIVLQDGKIVQMGNYAALMAEPGLFAELAKRQIA